MAWRIHDINVRALVIDRTVLGQNRNSPLFFKIVGIHDAFRHLLVFRKGTSLLEQFINHGGFSVVDVGDDGDIAQGAHRNS